ncbi:type II toxin-antitoxin system HicB family antitoxin [Dethiosulfovibrio sp. F2B]|uniref:type II toxin-antitoxin system HicB family antitoxin n=1 Tax=Dethiosulfovibrio faecalis TaxID=2720018 RepID=UPI001F3986A8|nr:type II toxin-antitoxin system HicB family antitoxin [Dethiosulfovibrio faecalis]MCF4152612.1 type II toxin-antitoxin system HicB family antitoxin [Dethiosulfovibrio faecalis]
MKTRPDKYRYPAILGYDVATTQYYVLWPDLPGCTTTGTDEDEALGNAREAMSLHLWGMEDDGDAIPAPTPIQQLDLSEYEEDGNKFVVVLVEIWMPSFRERMETKAVNRTVTLPGWMDREAKQASLNYSQVLQDGIMERLKISRTVTKEKKERIGLSA